MINILKGPFVLYSQGGEEGNPWLCTIFWPNLLINSPFTLALAATVEMPGEFVSATKQSIRKGKVIHFSVFTDNCFEMHNYFKAVEMKAMVEKQCK